MDANSERNRRCLKMGKNNPRSVTAGLMLTLLLGSAPLVARIQERGFYIETPYVYQVENYCGPAALTMILRYWGHSTDQYELALQYQPFPEKGLSGAQLRELAAGAGFSAYSFAGQPDELREHLVQGRPVIVALQSSALLNTNHYVVVVGWDPANDEWVVQDPVGGPYQRIGASDFLNRWAQLDNWTLLVVPDSAP